VALAREAGPWLQNLREDPDQAAREIGAAAMFAWAHGHLVARGHLDWIAALPLEQHLTLPDATRILAAHAAPGSDGTDQRWLVPTQSDDEMRALHLGPVVCGPLALAHGPDGRGGTGAERGQRE
jgi:hypothetical protein